MDPDYTLGINNGRKVHIKSNSRSVFLAIFIETYFKKKHISMCCYPLKSQTLHSFCSIHYKYHIFYQVVQNPRHLGTDLDISVLDISGQYSILTTIVWYLLIVNIFVLVVL